MCLLGASFGTTESICFDKEKVMTGPAPLSAPFHRGVARVWSAWGQSQFLRPSCSPPNASHSPSKGGGNPAGVRAFVCVRVCSRACVPSTSPTEGQEQGEEEEEEDGAMATMLCACLPALLLHPSPSLAGGKEDCWQEGAWLPPPAPFQAPPDCCVPRANAPFHSPPPDMPLPFHLLGL